VKLVGVPRSFRSIDAILLLRSTAGLSLSEAKVLIESVMSGQPVVVEVGDMETVDRLRALGVEVSVS
jgi:hypothetical protein